MNVSSSTISPVGIPQSPLDVLSNPQAKDMAFELYFSNLQSNLIEKMNNKIKDHVDNVLHSTERHEKIEDAKYEFEQIKEYGERLDKFATFMEGNIHNIRDINKRTSDIKIQLYGYHSSASANPHVLTQQEVQDLNTAKNIIIKRMERLHDEQDLENGNPYASPMLHMVKRKLKDLRALNFTTDSIDKSGSYQNRNDNGKLFSLMEKLDSFSSLADDEVLMLAENTADSIRDNNEAGKEKQRILHDYPEDKLSGDEAIEAKIFAAQEKKKLQNLLFNISMNFEINKQRMESLNNPQKVKTGTVFDYVDPSGKGDQAFLDLNLLI